MMKNKNKHIGTSLIMIGLVLVVAGVALSGWHYWSTCRRVETTQKILLQMDDLIWGEEGAQDEEMAWKLKNLYKTYPDVEMPVAYIDGEAYIGRVDISSLGLTLPVLSARSDDSLTLPCRYEGSAYQNDLIIQIPVSSFQAGSLKTLGTGDRISFTDMDGNCFTYDVTEVEQMEPEGSTQLQAGDWDLSVCVPSSDGGALQVVRCKTVQEDSTARSTFLPAE
jgi:sortase A